MKNYHFGTLKEVTSIIWPSALPTAGSVPQSLPTPLCCLSWGCSSASSMPPYSWKPMHTACAEKSQALSSRAGRRSEHFISTRSCPESTRRSKTAWETKDTFGNTRNAWDLWQWLGTGVCNRITRLIFQSQKHVWTLRKKYLPKKEKKGEMSHFASFEKNGLNLLFFFLFFFNLEGLESAFQEWWEMIAHMTWRISAALGKANWEICGSWGAGRAYLPPPSHPCWKKYMLPFFLKLCLQAAKKGSSFDSLI